MFYLLEHKPTNEVAVYRRKLNAVYDHIRYKRHQQVHFRECEEHLLEQHTHGRAILHPEQSGKLRWAARPGHSVKS